MTFFKFLRIQIFSILKKSSNCRVRAPPQKHNQFFILSTIEFLIKAMLLPGLFITIRFLRRLIWLGLTVLTTKVSEFPKH